MQATHMSRLPSLLKPGSFGPTSSQQRTMADPSAATDALRPDTVVLDKTLFSDNLPLFPF